MKNLKMFVFVSLLCVLGAVFSFGQTVDHRPVLDFSDKKDSLSFVNNQNGKICRIFYFLEYSVVNGTGNTVYIKADEIPSFSFYDVRDSIILLNSVITMYSGGTPTWGTMYRFDDGISRHMGIIVTVELTDPRIASKIVKIKLNSLKQYHQDSRSGQLIESVINLDIQRVTNVSRWFQLDNCSFTSGITELDNGLKIIAPNPLRKGEVIHVNDELRDFTVTVHDLLGRLMYSGSSNDIPTDSFRTGMCIVRLQTKSSGRVFIRKLLLFE